MSLCSSLVKSCLLVICVVLCANVQASAEKPVQHIKLDAVKDAATAKIVFNKETEVLRSKKNLDAKTMQEIHIITYSLEKSVAYYVESGDKETQIQAKVLADVVEELHLSSENLRKDESKNNLKKYLQLADKFKKVI